MKILQYLIIISIFIREIKNDENQNHAFYRCGVDDYKTEPLPAKNIFKINKDKRNLNNEENDFKDFLIYLDLININNDIVKYHLEQYEELFIDSLNKVVKTLETLLEVKKLDYFYSFTDEQIRDIDIEDWNKTVVGSEAIDNGYNVFESGIDLIIFGRFDDEMDVTTLANAGARYAFPDTKQPLIGVVNINSNVNYSKINSKEYFQSIIIHEFTHILGFSNNYFTFLNITFSKIDSNGIQRHYINSTRVLEVAKKYYNCSDIDGVELEESGGDGTAGSHWEARILLGEYMNGVIYPEEQVISEFTLALLEDTGYYKANYYTGGLMRYGKGKGCDFIKNRCVNDNHEINPKFENEFYDSISSLHLIDASCSSGRQSRTYYAWWEYNNLTEYYRYFENEKYGGFSPADFCPVAMEHFDENINSYYTGHCSLKGNGGYGTHILYNGGIKWIDQTSYQIVTFSNKSEELYFLTGETNSEHSFCYQSTLIKNEQNYDYLNIVRAVCYESFCSDLSLTIKINEDYFVCPRTGGKIEVEGYKGYFLCPDYNLICSGTVICNDMFDCVEKKSETKEESYYYNYESKTSQNIENNDLQFPDNETNYELGTNGICPINCKQCRQNNKCIKCRNEFGFVGSKENEEINCLSLLELSNGNYYQENNIYYPLIENSINNSINNTFENSVKEIIINSLESDTRYNINEVNSMNASEYEHQILEESKILISEISNEYKLQSDSVGYDINRSDSVINQSNSIEIQTVNLTYPKLTTSIVDIDSIKIPFFELFILQVRIINNTLTIFATISKQLEKLHHIKIYIDLYKNGNIRNLEDSVYKNHPINLYINENDIIKPNEIIKLTSNDKFEENSRIVVNPVKNSDYQMKVLNNDIKILDTKENYNLIQAQKLVDLSTHINNNQISFNTYNIKSISTGCKFDLTSTNQIKENKNEFSLKFIESNNNNKNIIAKCNLQKNNNKIPCSLDEETDKNYKLDSYSGSNEEGNAFFTITSSSESQTFRLCCYNDIEKKINRVNIGMIIIICGVLFVVIVCTLIIVLICCKKKKVNKIYINKRHKINSFSDDTDSEKDSYYKRKRRKKNYYS